jgi:hypothetical protein
MKKIVVINGILLAIYLILNIVVLNWLDVKINENFTAPFFIYPMAEKSYNVVNLGTSHGEVGFDWINLENTEIEGLNLGLSGKPFIYDYFLLDYYKNHIKSEAIILLPISLHSFCMSQARYSPIDSVYNIELPLLGMVRLNYLWDFLSYPREYPNNDFNGDYIPKSILPKKCNKEVLDYSISYINKIAKAYPNLVLVTTPHYHDALADYSEFYEFYELINAITDEYKISYFDYSRDERFYDSNLFYDVTHLNDLGRESFTKIIVKEIIEPIRNR